MTDPKPTVRKPEHDDIRRARRDVTDRANEFSLAMIAVDRANAKVQAAMDDATLKESLKEFEQATHERIVSQRKLQDAQSALETQLMKVRRG